MSDTYRRTDALVWMSFALGLVHVADNFSSGRTFREPYLPATPLQFGYLLPLIAQGLDAGPLTTTVTSAVMLVAHLLGHYLPFSPDRIATFYTRWTDGSNRLQLHSPAMGRVSQGVQLSYFAVTAGLLASAVSDGIEHGFTWRKKELTAPASTPSFEVSPLPDGAQVWFYIRF